MTPARAAAYFGSATLLGAWLASAAAVSMRQPPPPETPQPVRTSGTETLAADVEAQAVRLKERLAAAPVPQAPARNPFAFASREPPRVRRAAAPIEHDVPAVPALPPEPPLDLIGIAEQQTESGVVRTAMITAGEELFLLTEGQALGPRYKVSAVSADAVELTDSITGAVRRLGLR